MSAEARLRQRLHAVADDGAWYGGMGDDAAVDDVLDRRRTQRRQRATVGAAAVVVAAVVALVPVLADRAPDPDTGQTATTEVPFEQLPTRGSLAGDAAYVAAVRDAGWPDALSISPEPADRHVAFVGDLAGSRLALVVGETTSGPVGVWSSGPVGAPAAELVPDLGAVIGVDGSFVREPDAPGTPAVVIARPGDTVEASPRATVEADGTVDREYRPVDTLDGVAVVPVDTDALAAARFRVEREGVLLPSRPVSSLVPYLEQVYSEVGGGPWGEVSYRVDTVPPYWVMSVRSGALAVDPAVVRAAVDHVSGPTGYPVAELYPHLLWSGGLSLGSGGTVDVAVVAITLPSGAVAVGVAGGVYSAAEGGSIGTCGRQVYPAGTSIDELSVVASCYVSLDNGGAQLVYVATAPERATRLELDGTAPDGTPVGEIVPLDQGHALVASDADLLTASVAGDGYARERLPVLDQLDDGPDAFDRAGE